MKYSRTQIANAVVDMITEHGQAKAAQALAEVLVATGSKLDKDLLMMDIARATEQKHGIANVVIESARDISPAAQQQVADYMKLQTGATDIVITNEIHPELIGGLRARTSEIEIDWSIQSKLNKLQQGEN